jgi:hypothetical protein
MFRFRKIALIIVISILSVSIMQTFADTQSQHVIAFQGGISSTNLVDTLGISGYCTSTTAVQNTIDYMSANGLNIFRLGFSPPWSSARPYNKNLIQYYLDHSNYRLIVDINHLYPGSSSWDEFEANVEACTQAALQVCADFPNNQRVIVELVNEYYQQSRYIQYIQPMINAIRQAGYTNPLLVNKYANFAWNCLAFTDPLNNLYVGTHKYFNTLTAGEVDDMISHMQDGLNRGYKLINTEVGAADSTSDFSTQNVAALNQFLAWCRSNGVGNCVWYYENVAYATLYAQLGLQFSSPS